MKSIITWDTDLKSAPRNEELLILCDGQYGRYITTGTWCGNAWLGHEYTLSGVQAWSRAYTELEMEIIEETVVTTE